MANIEKQRMEELAAIANQQRTSERLHQALIKVRQQLVPHGNGTIVDTDIEELNAANADHQAASNEMNRICEEIRIGQRR